MNIESVIIQTIDHKDIYYVIKFIKYVFMYSEIIWKTTFSLVCKLIVLSPFKAWLKSMS